MRTTIASIALLLGSLLGAAACHDEPELQARTAELADLPGIAVKIAGADLDHAQAQAIAKHVEGQASDAKAAMVRMKKGDQGPATLEIELYAKTLPPGAALVADLKAAYPMLADATISVAPATGSAPELPVVQVSDELSPAAAKQEILEQLQADGVEGEVDVQIHDGPDGRRIEVKVEKESHE